MCVGVHMCPKELEGLMLSCMHAENMHTKGGRLNHTLTCIGDYSADNNTHICI